MGLQALMSVRELLTLDVERIFQGLYAESASLRAHVTHGISRLDVERLSQVVEVNEGTIALGKPFAKAFELVVPNAKTAAESMEAFYEERIPAIRTSKQC